jgi:hypothetical protein
MSRATHVWLFAGLLFPVFLQESATRAQENPAYVSQQHNVSFRPPPGWTTDILVQYAGPQRTDGTRPALNLAAQNSQVDLSEQGIDSLSEELAQEFGGARFLDRRRTKVAGVEALQIEVSYEQGDVPMRMRQVYLPVAEQGRTYLFTFVDAAAHFDETAGAAATAMSSFTVVRPQAPQSASSDTASGSDKTALLILTGVISLVLITGAGYLLLQKQHQRQRGR